MSLLFRAPLEELANPAKTPNPAKAPWYFLGLQELVSHSALLGGVVAPTLMVLRFLRFLTLIATRVDARESANGPSGSSRFL